jgi:hypothetical protein
MRFIKVFEKFGISSDLEEQVEDIYKQINSEENKSKNEFSFIYYCDDIRTPFKLVIMSAINRFIDRNTLGEFEVGNGLTIRINKKTNKSTLLHEVKHLDYYVRKRDCFKNLFYLSSKINFIDNSHSVDVIKEIFYIYDENEFQSRYHGYYIDFDEFLKKNLSEKPTSGEIFKLFNKFFESNKDKSWTWYISSRKFKFEDYFKPRTLRNLLSRVGKALDSKGVTTISDKSFDSILSYLKNNAINIYNKIFDIRPKQEEDLIRKYKSYFETQINIKRKRYTQKMFKLVNIMCDKYVK